MYSIQSSFFDGVEEVETKNRLLNAGIYQADIVSADFNVSKNGNDMLEVSFLIEHAGNVCRLKDYLLLNSDKNFCRLKLKNFLKACGMFVEGKDVAIDAVKLVGRKVECELKISEERIFGDKKYPPRNEIVGYYYIEQPEVIPAAELEDGIPF
jgi:hypothetical protein